MSKGNAECNQQLVGYQEESWRLHDEATRVLVSSDQVASLATTAERKRQIMHLPTLDAEIDTHRHVMRPWEEYGPLAVCVAIVCCVGFGAIMYDWYQMYTDAYPLVWWRLVLETYCAVSVLFAALHARSVVFGTVRLTI